MALAHATVLLHFIILKNSNCTETNTSLDHVTYTHLCWFHLLIPKNVTIPMPIWIL